MANVSAYCLRHNLRHNPIHAPRLRFMLNTWLHVRVINFRIIIMIAILIWSDVKQYHIKLRIPDAVPQRNARKRTDRAAKYVVLRIVNACECVAKYIQEKWPMSDDNNTWFESFDYSWCTDSLVYYVCQWWAISASDSFYDFGAI